MAVLSDKRRPLLMLLVLFFLLPPADAQEFYLSRRITLNLTSVTIESALAEISRAARFSFSYNTDLFKNSARVNVKANNAKVKTLLNSILGSGIEQKEVGGHVILMQARVRQDRTPEVKAVQIISGFVFDSQSGLPVVNATVYEVGRRRSALTDAAGRYSLSLPVTGQMFGLCYCRNGFEDSVLFVKSGKDCRRDVRLRKLPEIVPIAGRQAVTGLITVDSIALVTWMVPEKALLTSANLRVYGTRAFQFSFIPYLSTNWMNKGSYTNAFSFNVLAGYNGGVNGFELGGLVNINRNDVKGLQIGGLGNVTGGKTTGVAVGGLFNVNLGTCDGWQLAGLANVLSDTLSGVQIGGLCNWLDGKMKGLQIGGLLNVATKNVDGFQLAGLMNVSPKDITKSQISGFLNFGRDVGGLQFSGFSNISTGAVSGAQISAFFNYAASMRGLQFACFNFSDSVETGVPIGFFSYVQHGGYHRFEVSADEVFYANLSYKSGVKHFYNIFKAGVGQEYFLNFGYGIGTIFRFGRVVSLSLDLTSAGVFSTNGGMKYHGLLSKLIPALEFRLARNFALFAGPAANLYWFNTGLTEMPNGIAPYIIWERTAEPPVPHQLQFWVGGYAGIRI